MRLENRLAACLLIAIFTLVGCDSDPDVDSGLTDSGTDTDSGMTTDSGMETDSGMDTDAGAPDSGFDAGMNMEPDGTIDTPTMSVTINVGETVDFTGTCTDPESRPVTHLWDFGGGATSSTDEDPGPVQFDTAGAYTVTYTCTDDMGLADSTPATLMVAVNADTMATIDTPTMDMVIAVGESLDFAGTCSDPEADPTLTHAWDFDGGAAASTLEDPGTVVFATAGMYVVTYTCSDSSGGMGSAMITVTVNTPPDGVIDTPATDVSIAPGGMVDFTATCTDADGDLTLMHTWDFGGGATAVTVEDPGVTTFATAGVYTVTYTCSDSLGFDDLTPATVTVRVAVPTRYVAFTGDVLVDLQTQVVFTDISGASPSAPIDPIAGGWPAFADMASTSAIQLSSTGRYVAFVADATTDTSDDLYIVDLETGAAPVAVNMTGLTGGADVEAFEWSPDGLKIAYTANTTTTGEDDLNIVDITAGLSSPTTIRAHAALPIGGDVFPTFYQSPASNDDFEWSANSTRIFFRGDVVTSGVTEGFMFDLLNTVAGAQRLHAPSSGTLSVDAVYALGNDYVVLAGDLDLSGATDFYAVDVSGAGPFTAVRLSAVAATTTREGLVSNTRNRPSPDGTGFVFVGDYDTDLATELWYVDFRSGMPAMGSAVKLHVAYTSGDQDVIHTTWSPVGNRLIYRSDQDINIAEELFLVELGGASPGTPARINTALTASAQDIDNYTWAPDGSGVAFDGDLTTDNVDELYYVPLPAGAAPGAQVTLNQPFPSTADADGQVIWTSNAQLVFEADPLTASQDNLYLVDVGMPGVVTQLNAPHTAPSGFPNFDTFSAGLIPDGSAIIARGDPESSGVTEAFLMRLSAPGTQARLHSSLVGTSQDVFFVLGEP